MARHVEIDIDSDADTSGFLATAAAADRAADRVDGLGDGMRGTTRDSAALDVQIVKTKTFIHQLGEEFVRTGEVDVFKHLRNQRGILTSLQAIAQETDKIALGSLFHDAALDAELLANKIRDTKIAVDELGAAYVRTGDKDVLKSLREQRNTLQTLQQIQKGLKEAAQATGDLADGSERATTSMTRLGSAAGSLEQRLDSSKDAIVALIREFERTGNTDILANLRDERGVLRNLQSMNREIEMFGEGVNRAGRNLGDLGNASGVLSALVRSVPPQVTVGLATAFAVPLGAAINTAILLAVGGGSLAAGIAAAAQSARVQDAFSGTFKRMFDQFVAASGPLADPLVRAAFAFGDAFDAMLPGIQAGMQKLSTEVYFLSDGLTGFFQNIGPGFAAAFEAAMPVLRELSASLPELGQGLSNFFAGMAAGGPGAVAFFSDLISLSSTLLTIWGGMIAVFSGVYNAISNLGHFIVNSSEGFRQLGGLMHLVELGIAAFGSETDEAGLSVEELKRKMAEQEQQQVFQSAMAESARIMSEAARAADEAARAISTLLTTQLADKDAQLAFKQGRLDMIEALKNSKGALDDNSLAGLRSQQALISQAQAAIRARDAAFEQAKGTMGASAAAAYADGVLGKLVDQLYADAKAAGVSKEKVDGVTGALNAVPGYTPAELELMRKGMTQNEIARIREALKAAEGNYSANFTTTYTTVNRTISERIDAGNTVPGTGGRRILAKGGVIHADVGLISKPGIYKGQGDGFPVVMAEGVTGYEGFLPQLGIPRSRAAALLNEMAGWHDFGIHDRRGSGYASPAGMGGATGGGGRVYQINVNVAPGANAADAGAAVIEVIEAYEKLNGASWRDN